MNTGSTIRVMWSAERRQTKQTVSMGAGISRVGEQ